MLHLLPLGVEEGQVVGDIFEPDGVWSPRVSSSEIRCGSNGIWFASVFPYKTQWRAKMATVTVKLSISDWIQNC